MEKTAFEISLPVLGTIAGSILGVIGTLLVNGQRSKIEYKQAELKRNWDIADAEKKNSEEKQEQKYEVYNKILKAAGEVQVTSHIGGSYTDFNIKDYEEYIRPEIFDGLHKLDPDVFDLVMELEDEIDRAHHFEEAEPDQVNRMADLYWKITSKIKEYYKKR
ncbi:putative Phage protein [Brevibacillus sp. IT-7CA2]|uniref:hypothetical protein n=1 Tax=Brevibacillus sp. IT-7CA2 TaxID=3026436 RepID=UPI0039DFB355